MLGVLHQQWRRIVFMKNWNVSLAFMFVVLSRMRIVFMKNWNKWSTAASRYSWLPGIAHCFYEELKLLWTFSSHTQHRSALFLWRIETPIIFEILEFIWRIVFMKNWNFIQFCLENKVGVCIVFMKNWNSQSDGFGVGFGVGPSFLWRIEKRWWLLYIYKRP